MSRAVPKVFLTDYDLPHHKTEVDALMPIAIDYFNSGKKIPAQAKHILAQMFERAHRNSVPLEELVVSENAKERRSLGDSQVPLMPIHHLRDSIMFKKNAFLNDYLDMALVAYYLATPYEITTLLNIFFRDPLPKSNEFSAFFMRGDKSHVVINMWKRFILIMLMISYDFYKPQVDEAAVADSAIHGSRSISPRSTTPRGRSTTPRGRSTTPRGRSTTPKGRGGKSRKRSNSKRSRRGNSKRSNSKRSNSKRSNSKRSNSKRSNCRSTRR